MNDKDILQIKIEEARDALPAISRQAIDAVDWKSYILTLREKKGFNFEQLEDLTIETELLLCGLADPNQYQIELEKRMKISSAEAAWLVDEMNINVFGRIKAEIIKQSERQANEAKAEKVVLPEKSDTEILNNAGIKIINKTDRVVPPTAQTIPEVKKEPLVMSKLNGTYQMQKVKTEYSLNNISKGVGLEELENTKEIQAPKGGIQLKPDSTVIPKAMNDVKPVVPKAPAKYPPKADPYRINPGE